jgi:prevent-host-death family protein
MVRVTAEQLGNASEFVRAEAHRAPVEVTYHGRAELVVLSLEDYELLRQNRKIATLSKDLPLAKLERIASNRMDSDHADLDSLMND